MDTWLRNDAIELKPEIDRADFERFMLKELFPVFKHSFGNLTRKTIAVLEEQHLLKEQQNQGKYIWVARWSGPLE